MKKLNTPYNFVEKTEYNIYKNVGRKHKKSSNSLSKALRTYSDWKDYFINKFIRHSKEDYNFMHYLIRYLRIYERLRGIYQDIVVPIYVTMISIYTSIIVSISSSIYFKIWMATFLVIVVIIILMCWLHKVYTRINFYKDCIDIIKKHSKYIDR